MDTHIDTIKKTLETEKSRVEAELATVGHKNPSVTGDWVATGNADATDRADETEIADSLETLETNTAIVAQLETQLGDVLHALEKISAGTYEVCDVCSEPIESDRLEANSAAATCKAHME